MVVAGREDFVFPPECQHELADGIPRSQLLIADDAGHSPQEEEPAEVMPVLRKFLAATTAAG